MKFMVFKDESGEYRWRMIGDDGEAITIRPGSAPGFPMGRKRAAIRRGVQQALRDLAERSASEARA